MTAEPATVPARSMPEGRAWRGMAQLAALCLCVFVVVRALPTRQCAILHYGRYLNEAGAIEQCGEGEAGFADLDVWKYPVAAELDPGPPPEAGHRKVLRVRLTGPEGTPFELASLAVNHTRPLHALIVDEALEDYQHVHPEPDARPGWWSFEWAPARAGPYTAYFDFIPLATARRMLAAARIDVQPASTASLDRLDIEARAAAREPVQFRLEPASPPRAGRSSELILTARHPDGTVAVWEPVMGAYAHVVAFAPGRSGFAHLHPLSAYPQAGAPSPPALIFQFEPDRPGRYRLWAQARPDGVEQFFPFDITVTGGR